MKKYLFYSIAALALASCTNDEFLGTGPAPETDKAVADAIAFGGTPTNLTRAGEYTGAEAAEKLHNNFVVYGFKTSADETADGTTDQPVFNRYNVNYVPGTAYTTESNSTNWEYVGYNSLEDQLQTIKYWDLSAKSYVFSAVSGTGITATKTTTGSTIYDKGWTVTVPAGGSLSDLYASDRQPVAPSAYKETVTLTFRALGTKVRFAMYETVPGYSVHIDKVYYGETGAWNNTTTNFAINGIFKTANATEVTPLTVTYYDADSDIENRPKVTFTDTDVTVDKYGIFGANIQATPAIGTNSVEATYDQSDKSYTMILPYENAGGLQLYVDYTLTATDGTAEKIQVMHASAKVPQNYTQWKPNFAYTYIFKISDNTNGTTVDPGTDPDDPASPFNPDDPTDLPDDDDCGLFPITFDAVVISDDEDVQETITTVSEASITTYAQGVVVTENNEYIDACDVYASVVKGTAVQALTADGNNTAIFEVHNAGEIEKIITEEVAANYLRNFCTLTPVTGVDFNVTEVPLTNGTTLTFAAGTLVKFPAKAGKVYAIVFNDGTKDTYKIVRVKGDEAAVAYTLTDATTGSITTVDGTHTLTLKQDDVEVYGAVPCFTVTSTNGNNALKIAAGTGLGEYIVSVDNAAVMAGKANDVYTVAFQDQSVSITVDIAAELTEPTLTISAGSSKSTTLKIAGAATAGAKIVNPVAGLTVTDNGDGSYTVAADQNAVSGKFTNVTIAGVPLTIYLNNYAFDPTALTIIKPMSANGTGEVALMNLRLNANGNIGANDITVAGGSGLTIANKNAAKDGNYTLTASAGGEYTLTFQHTAAKCVVTVNEYSIATPASIKKATGIANIEVKCNGEAINASKASLVETYKPTGAVYTVTTNGKSLKFSSASVAGNYEFDYKVGDVVVAHVIVTVTE